MDTRPSFPLPPLRSLGDEARYIQDENHTPNDPSIGTANPQVIPSFPLVSSYLGYTGSASKNGTHLLLRVAFQVVEVGAVSAEHGVVGVVGCRGQIEAD